jgi:hypothetical protein
MLEAERGARAGEASGLYGLKFGPGGTGGAGGGIAQANQATEALKKFNAAKMLNLGSTRTFAQLINLALPGMGGWASSLLQIAGRFGLVGVALIAATAAIKPFIAEMQRAHELQTMIAEAFADQDFDRLVNGYKELQKQQRDNEAVAQRALQNVTGLFSYLDRVGANVQLIWRDYMGKGLKATDTDLAKLKPAVAALGKEVWVKDKALDNMRAMAEVEKTAAQFAIRTAQTAGEVEAAYDSLAEASKKLNDAEKARIDRAAEALINSEKARDNEARKAEIYAQAAEEKKQIDLKSAQSDKETTEARLKQLAQISTAEVQHTNTLAAEQLKRAQSASALREAEIESAESLAQMRATAMDQVLSGAGKITDVFNLQRDAAEAAEQAAQQAFERTADNLKKMIAAGVDVAESTRRLTELTAQRETEQAAARDQRLTSMAKKAEQLAAEATRVYNAELQRVTGTQEAYFNARQAFGEDTLQAEIKFQQSLNGLYREGTADWYNGMAKVASLQKQMREEARGAFQDIAGEAAESLKKKGKKNITIADLQKESAVLEKAANKTLSEAGGGRAVNPDDLFKALSRQGARESFAAKGGNLRDLFERAITPGMTAQQAGVGAPGENFSGLMKASADLFNTGVADFMEAVSAFANATAQQNSEAGGAAMSSKIGRMGQLESKRGPAPAV